MSEEPFLKRWSRRKVEAREGPKPGDEPAAAEEAKVAALDSRSERCDVEPEAGPQEKRELTEADFADVDFDALDAKSDYSRFLQRRRAREHQEQGAAPAVDVGRASTRRPIRSRTTCTTTRTPPWPCRPARSRPPTASARASSPTRRWPSGRSSASRRRRRMMRPPAPSLPRARKRPLLPRLSGLSRKSPSRRSRPTNPRCTPCCASRTSITPRSIRRRATTWSTWRSWPSPNVRFVVARRDGIAVGCGALVLGVDGEAELKRMFVAPEARGQQDRQPHPRRAGSQCEGRRRARHPPRNRRAPARVAGPLPPPRLHRARTLRDLPARPAQHLLREVDRVTMVPSPRLRHAEGVLSARREGQGEGRRQSRRALPQYRYVSGLYGPGDRHADVGRTACR